MALYQLFMVSQTTLQGVLISTFSWGGEESGVTCKTRFKAKFQFLEVNLLPKILSLRKLTTSMISLYNIIGTIGEF